MLNDFLHTIISRKLLYQISDDAALETLSKNRKIKAYIGIDCTAPGLHVGNLMPLMMVYWLQKTGNQAVILLGSATSMIGDPSGKDQTRKLLSYKTIENNKKGIVNDILTLFKRHDYQPELVDNLDWTKDCGYIEFMRNIGSQVSVNRLLTMESVKNRIEHGKNLSFLEFSYSLMQANDFVHLSRHYQCNTQIGGSDQWGNIVIGLDLARRMVNKELYGITTPLLVDSQNRKMGKSQNGAVWLCPQRCSDLDFWQFWRNLDDCDVKKYLLMFTTLPEDEIKHLSSLSGKEINHAKKTLAYEVLKFVRGKYRAEQTLKLAESVYEKQEIHDQLKSYTVGARTGKLVDWLAETGEIPSKSECRRLIQNSGIKINDSLVEDINYEIGDTDWRGQDRIKISIGKKRHLLIKIKQ